MDVPATEGSDLESLKMWIVSESLDTARRVLARLKLMEKILAGYDPRRN